MGNGAGRYSSSRRALFASSIGLALMLAPFARGQQPAQQPSSQSSAQAQNSGVTDANREEMANFDRFLGTHPILERELESNPSLVNDPNYVQSEPDLQIFLSHHPGVKAEIARDPGYLERRRTSNENATSRGTSNDLSADDAGRMSRFLDAHPDIALQLKQNPALIDDSSFLDQHHDLQTFLDQNPRVRQEIAQNPRFLTQHENFAQAAAEHNDSAAKYKSSTTSSNHQSGTPNSNYASGTPNSGATNTPPSNPSTSRQPVQVTENRLPNSTPPSSTSYSGTNPAPNHASQPVVSEPNYGVDTRPPAEHSAAGPAAAPPPVRSHAGVTPEDVARMNQFLEDHRDIAKQLQKDPLLVTDHKFLDKHKELRRFFDQNIRLREVFAEDPGFFARVTSGSGTAADESALNANLTGRDLLEMERFLQKHKDIAKDLTKDPMLVKNPQFLGHHKDLRRFFDEHAHIQEEFDINPRYFMQRESDLQRQKNVELVNR